MAENKDGQERTEQATPKRQQEARRKGQIPRSRELNTLAMLMAAAGTLVLSGGHMAAQFSALLHNGLSFDRRAIFSPRGLIDAMEMALGAGLALVAPFFVISVIVALVSSVALGGWGFSVEALTPKLDKLNPLKGFKRMFSVRGLVELLKALAKFLLVAGVGIGLFMHYSSELIGLGYESVEAALAHAGEILAWCFLLLSATLILVAAADVPFQLWDHKRNLKMTRQEVKDELKDTEGKPEVKSRIKQMQREIAQRRMMEAVPDADVVITNPTHYAVALKYDDARMGAPVVVAKGKDLIAREIRERAIAAEVPIVSAPPLARAIFFSTELDQEIPAALYLAVAQVLAYVFQLRTAARHGGEVPPPPADIEVPEGFDAPPR
ncbi:flagellar biosynthesis protein FlhB [Thiohalobacter sp.]|uniref:flagellar biosynthesis protein FlhB n=1 Tax=Thiohalobacter sp. TaxID=2025948 RepID=UPI00262131C1|nr:flagellar biosynthesis protein FlhB [Thiohalobacter sp.]